MQRMQQPSPPQAGPDSFARPCTPLQLLPPCSRRPASRLRVGGHQGRLPCRALALGPRPSHHHRAPSSHHAVAGLETSLDGSTNYTLILYTKQNCPLCEGLQQKLEAVVERAQFLPSVLSNARVEVRDISGNPAWEAAFALSVPVLVRAEVDGSNEIVLPRPAPRLGAEGLQRHLEKVLAEDRWW